MTPLADDQCMKLSYNSESRRHLISSEEPKLKLSEGKKKLKNSSCYLTLSSEMCHFFVLVSITSFQMGLIFFLSKLIKTC